jgi:hypothetical protein
MYTPKSNPRWVAGVFLRQEEVKAALESQKSLMESSSAEKLSALHIEHRKLAKTQADAHDIALAELKAEVEVSV